MTVESQVYKTAKNGLTRGEREPRIAILVLGCLLTVYDRCIKTIRATWGSQSVDNVDIFYVYGAQHATTSDEIVAIEDLIGQAPPQLQDFEVWASDDVILCGATDVREGQENCILRKRLIAFDYLANKQGYDFIYTVCATSYVDVERLRQYVRTLPFTGVYHGPLAVDGAGGYPFVSGASLLLSKDIAADLANHATTIILTYPESLPDDVVFGHWIATKYANEPVAEISSRIASEQKPTNNETFVMPNGQAIINFVVTPEYSHMPQEKAFHYHFHSRRMWEMENFHRRFFAA